MDHELWKHYAEVKEVSHKGPRSVWFHLYQMSGVGKCLETKRRLVVAWAEERGEDDARRCEFSFWGSENVLQLFVMMDAVTMNILKVTDLYSLSRWIVGWVNFSSIKPLKNPTNTRDPWTILWPAHKEELEWSVNYVLVSEWSLSESLFSLVSQRLIILGKLRQFKDHQINQGQLLWCLRCSLICWLSGYTAYYFSPSYCPWRYVKACYEPPT